MATVHILEHVSGNMQVRIVGDHYAVLKDGSLFGTVEKFMDQWTWNRLGGDRFYAGSPSMALAQAQYDLSSR